MERHLKSSPPFISLIGVGILTLFGKAGDAVAPTLVGSMPLFLLCLNANDLHCALTSTTVDTFPWFAVALVRRLAEDPFFFYLGWRHGKDAIEWAHRFCPSIKDHLTESSFERFRNASYLAVVLEPGAVVCTLAGASNMPPHMFVSLNIVGTTARLLLIRAIGWVFSSPVHLALDFIAGYRFLLLCPTILLAVVASWGLASRWRKSELKSE